MKRIKLKKRKNKLRFRRKLVVVSTLVLFLMLGIGYSLLSVNLNILGNITVKKHYGRTLYEVMEKEADIGTYAQEYTGEHHDSFTVEPSKKIYHWKGSNDYVKEHRNVIFADHCWQIVRTTDTGGVKMIYNGEVENNQCLDTRSNHIGYSGSTSTNLLTTYYYGTSYTYDKTNNVFSLDGTITTGTIQTGQYTCKKTSATETCSSLYYVDTLYSGSNYNVLTLNADSHYTQFGTLKYNKSSSSLAYVGYMYNDVYDIHKTSTNTESIFSKIRISTDYYYANSYDYNVTNPNNYTLINPYKVNSADDYSSLVGKYTYTNNSITYYGGTIYYIAAVEGDYMYCIQFQSGNNLTYYNHTYTYGDSYTDNGNGTYTINNATTINRTDFLINYRDIADKYICKNSTNDTCSVLFYSSNSNDVSFRYYTSTGVYKYASGFSYNSSTDEYTLNDDNITFWDVRANYSSLHTHHYTCFNTTGKCTSISYIYDLHYANSELYYINLTSGNDVNVALDGMLFNNNVNTFNSIIKTGIDAWYKRYMTSYTNELEDTIFCNDRTINKIYGWAEDGTIGSDLSFNSRNTLNCINETDKFSMANQKAKLLYPVGLFTKAEMSISVNLYINQTGLYYWLMTPSSFYNNSS